MKRGKVKVSGLEFDVEYVLHEMSGIIFASGQTVTDLMLNTHNDAVLLAADGSEQPISFLSKSLDLLSISSQSSIDFRVRAHG